MGGISLEARTQGDVNDNKFIICDVCDKGDGYFRRDPAVGESPWLSEPIERCHPYGKLEFQNIMIGATNATNGSSSTNLSSSMSYGTTTSYEINIEASNSPSTMKAISWLSCIAKWMNSVGYIGECFVVYESVRMVFLETSLKQLGIEKLSARAFSWKSSRKTLIS
ncbi:hypothetical protein LguiB_027946 [Lonicera macranthoides]